MIESVSASKDAVRTPQSNKIAICKSGGCYDMATVSGFCRLHYLSNWKKVKVKEAKSQGQDLKKYLGELSTRFPEEFFEKLRADVEEMIAGNSGSESSTDDSSNDRSPFESASDSDEDIDTIIKGIRVEDY